MFACARSAGVGVGGLLGVVLAAALSLGGVGVMAKAWVDGGAGFSPERCAVACAMAPATQAGG